MKRVFLDANILFTAAHNPHGKAAFIVELGLHGHWRLFTSTYAAEEARRNLAIKFPHHLDALHPILEALTLIGAHKAHGCPAGLAVKDQPIYQAAVESRATHLLTGDIKDFGAFMNRPEDTNGMIIQTVADFLASL